MNQLILVVEDDAIMQKMALKILRSRGFSCELAVTGREAVAKAGAFRPGLILMDLSLPEMNGWEATRALKADPAVAGIPVVAVTAHAMVGDRETAIAAGCAECDQAVRTRGIGQRGRALHRPCPARGKDRLSNVRLCDVKNRK